MGIYPNLKQELSTCAKNIKDFLFNVGMQNGRVMDPQKNLRGDDSSRDMEG